MDAPRPPVRRLYADANATTPLHPAVRESLADASARFFGNPASLHVTGRMAREALEEARGQVAGLVGCLPEEVVFVSSGTEGNHQALLSAAGAAGGRRRVLLSAVEHPSVAGAAEILEERGFAVEEIPVDGSGLLDLEALEGRLRDDVAVVSVLSAHNETGVLEPVESVGALCRRHGALFLTDAVQAAGKVPLRWREALPDYLVVAAHKFYGPKGIAPPRWPWRRWEPGRGWRASGIPWKTGSGAASAPGSSAGRPRAFPTRPSSPSRGSRPPGWWPSWTAAASTSPPPRPATAGRSASPGSSRPWEFPKRPRGRS
jgi:cysteine desulfurase